MERDAAIAGAPAPAGSTVPGPTVPGPTVPGPTIPGPGNSASTTHQPAPRKPSGPPKLPWGGLLVLAAAGFTAVTTELLPSGLLPQISRDLGVGESAVGSLTGAYAAIIVFTAIPLSRLLAGRVPRKALLIGTLLAFALSNVLLASSPDLGLAVAARLLGGVAHGMLWSSMAPYVARIVPAHSVGKAMAVVFSGNSIALAVGAPLGTLMGSVLTWRASFLVLAGAGAALALLAVWVLPAAPDSGDNARPSLRGAMKLPGVIAIATAWPLLLLGHFTLFTYIAPFVHASGLPDAFTGISLSVVGAASLVGIWIAGLTADSYPRRSLVSAVALLVGAFALLPLLGGTWAGGLVLVIVWGIAFGSIGIYNQAAILRAGAEQKDAANGLTVVTIQLGIAVGAGYGALALTAVGPVLVPLAAAIPTAAALAIIVASRRGGYPSGPRELPARTRASRPGWASTVVSRAATFGHMSEEHAPNQDDAGQDDAGQDDVGQEDAGQDDRNGAGDPGEVTGTDLPAATVGSKLDPDFVPDESHENPNEERARKHPEETGS